MNPIDDYLAEFPAEVQAKLQALRALIRAEAPTALEKISYGMPTFDLNGNLVHYAAFAHHIGFYPTPSGIAAFQHEFTGYVFAKGSVQFPLDQPMPWELIRRIVRFRIEENQAKPKKASQRK